MKQPQTVDRHVGDDIREQVAAPVKERSKNVDAIVNLWHYPPLKCKRPLTVSSPEVS